MGLYTDISNDPSAVKLEVQELMNQASQSYAAGKADEAQMYMTQASELNKKIQPESFQTGQSDGGIALVKKESINI